jgi:glycosyltransferase involved in cell wall biosynthesis
MIFFDVTKTGAASHRSGLTRVSARLRQELGARAQPVTWDSRARELKTESSTRLGAGDWFLTTELFSEEERPGFAQFLDSRVCRTAALFHDAIPLKHPHITWPQSVARHPAYMKLLARFTRVWAVSQASAHELQGFWRWIGIEAPPPVSVLPLGADFNDVPRNQSVAVRGRGGPPQLLTLGIIEPRKNQLFLLEVCAELWRGGLRFALHIVGRVNPHFGAPIVARLKQLRRDHPALLHFHEAAPDAKLTELYRAAHATVFPTIAEGCGLPLLESLWMGVPCVCSNLPVLRENADGGGCLVVPTNDAEAWKETLTSIVSDGALQAKLRAEATSRGLPTWAEAAEILGNALH